MKNYQSEKLQGSDISSLMELEKEAFPLDQWSKEQMKNEFLLHPEGFRIIKKNNKVIAYIYFKKDEGGIICSLAVEKNERRKGLGKLLMKEAINSLKNQQVAKIIFYTREDNQIMLSLGDKLGFKIVDQIDKYYPENDKAIVLALFLT